jgi:hypothetical protein
MSVQYNGDTFTFRPYGRDNEIMRKTIAGQFAEDREQFFYSHLMDSEGNMDMDNYNALPSELKNWYGSSDRVYAQDDGAKILKKQKTKKPIKKSTKKTIKSAKQGKRNSARNRVKRFETVYSTGVPKIKSKAPHNRAASMVTKQPYRGIERFIGKMSPKAYKKMLKVVKSKIGYNPEL